MLQDAQARQQALSPNESFIVQAPAGSGKTELLTQRFLKLLTLVDAPEQIFALTFTRKAASEMRERVLSTLEACSRGDEPGHRTETFKLANAVLSRDESLGWRLLQHPGRLRILTLDALCQFLISAIPIQHESAIQSDIDLFPERLYERAALACFEHALKDPMLKEPLFSLLMHLDNRQDTLLALWIALLKTRDQWLGLLIQAKSYSKSEVEQGLKQLEVHAVERLLLSLPLPLRVSLAELCAQVAHYLPGFECLSNFPPRHPESSSMPSPEIPRPPRGLGMTSGVDCLEQCGDLSELSAEQAKAIARLCLTKQKTLRKKLDHHVGWTKDLCDTSCYQRIKAESEALFAALPDDFIQALILVQALPERDYDPHQWSILQALFALLPLLVAHLKLVFQAVSKSDFIEVSSKAVEALGEEDNPTDLALYLDYRIQHLLVDEFQDTSCTQFRLLSRLISGWQTGDGRSLFIVGDPMQSIYRFRQAEVALFLKVQQEGIGLLRLKNLSLQCNFRSSPRLIDFVNEQMSCIFPRQDNLSSGAVQFHPATAVQPSQRGSEVRAIQLENKVEEATHVLDLVQSHLNTYPDQTLAILVRSRTQLELIIPTLQKADIAFEGVDLFSLGSVTHLRDLYNLTQALLMPAEKLPWFCVLRSPYVGLSLTDLHAVALLVGSEPIYMQLAQLAASSTLSQEGQQRLKYAAAVFHRMFELRYQYALSEWLLYIHQQLHGERWCGPNKHQDLMQFFDLVDQLSVDHYIADWQLFDKYFQRLFVSQSCPAKLKIMTIHQSKGLEFDAVILPGLGAKTRKGDRPLLRLFTLVQSYQAELHLISPIKASEDEGSPLYDYLGLLDAEKEDYEQSRVLYVALTRAKYRLYLLDAVEKPATDSFRAKMQATVFAKHEGGMSSTNIEPQSTAVQISPQFYRVAIADYLQPMLPLCQAGHEQLTLHPKSMARELGVIAHRFLQWVCEHQIERMEDMPWLAVERACKEAGFLDDAKTEAMQVLRAQFASLFSSDRGRWIISNQEQAQNEYALMVASAHGPKCYVIDRTFYEAGQRWIIDFKTGLDDEPAELKHRAQLETYAGCFNEPVRCGIYYLATDRWIEWVYT